MAANITDGKENIICIGGIGGSGTRLFADILSKYVHMGNSINDSSDNTTFTLLFKRLKSLTLSEEEFDEIFSIFKKIMTNKVLNKKEVSKFNKIYLEDTSQDYLYDKTLAKDLSLCFFPKTKITNWGWKEPNTHIVLGHILRQGDNYKYIHIYRDGFMSAISPNQNQLKFWCTKKVTPSKSIEYWISVQEKIIEYKRKYPNSIFLIDYSIFIKSPEYYLVRLSNFCGYMIDIKFVKSLIKEPSKKKKINMRVFTKSQINKVKQLMLILSTL